MSKYRVLIDVCVTAEIGARSKKEVLKRAEDVIGDMQDVSGLPAEVTAIEFENAEVVEKV